MAEADTGRDKQVELLVSSDEIAQLSTRPDPARANKIRGRLESTFTLMQNFVHAPALTIDGAIKAHELTSAHSQEVQQHNQAAANAINSNNPVATADALHKLNQVVSSLAQEMRGALSVSIARAVVGPMLEELADDSEKRARRIVNELKKDVGSAVQELRDVKTDLGTSKRFLTTITARAKSEAHWSWVWFAAFCVVALLLAALLLLPFFHTLFEALKDVPSLDRPSGHITFRLSVALPGAALLAVLYARYRYHLVSATKYEHMRELLSGGFNHLIVALGDDKERQDLARGKLVELLLSADDLMAAAGEKTALLAAKALVDERKRKPRSPEH